MFATCLGVGLGQEDACKARLLLFAQSLLSWKDEIRALLTEVVEALGAKKASQPSSRNDELGAESQNPRRAYLVTLSHTDKEEGAGGQKLVAPGTYTRAEVKDFFLGALVSTQANREQLLTSMAVFQERHASVSVLSL